MMVFTLTNTVMNVLLNLNISVVKNWDIGNQLNRTLRDQGGHMMGYMILSIAAGLVIARLLGWVWR